MAVWANLSSLQLFTIRNNSMTGTLPNELATAWPHLGVLELGNNSFAGEVPHMDNNWVLLREPGACSGEACAMHLTSVPLCRHHPKRLVRAAADVPRSERQCCCGCAQLSPPASMPLCCGSVCNRYSCTASLCQCC